MANIAEVVIVPAMTSLPCTANAVPGVLVPTPTFPFETTVSAVVVPGVPTVEDAEKTEKSGMFE